MFHNSRAILALNGTLLIILGVSFGSSRVLHLVNVSDITDNQDAIDVGVALRKSMEAGCAFIGIILFSCQTSSKSIAQRLLFTSAFGFLLWIAALLHLRLSGRQMYNYISLWVFCILVCIVTVRGIAAFSRITFF